MTDDETADDTDEPTDGFAADADASGATIEYDWTKASGPSLAVIEAVAATTGREPTDVPPLHEYVDGDALDALVTSAGDRLTDNLRVSFSYDGYEVVVDGNGSVTLPIEPTDDGSTK